MLLLLVMAVLAGMILASIVMLSLNHYLHLRKRLTDLRLESINQVNWLLAQFLTNSIGDKDYVPSLDFSHEFQAAISKARALFSDAAWHAFQHVEVMVKPNLGAPPGEKGDVNAFLQAQDAALRALYREAGLRVRAQPFRFLNTRKDSTRRTEIRPGGTGA